MTNPGNFVWYELMTSDAKRLKAFIATSSVGVRRTLAIRNMKYTLLTVDEARSPV